MMSSGFFELHVLRLFYLPFILFLSPRVTGQCTTVPPPPLFFRLSNCSFQPDPAYYPDSESVAIVDSWGLDAFIGSPPYQQHLCLEPSTVTNNTVILKTDVCTNDHTSTFDQCVSRRGGLFNTDIHPNFTNISVSDLPPDDGWASFNPPGFGKAIAAPFQFDGDALLPSYPIALPDNAANSSVGQLGLANDSVLLQRLVDIGLSACRAFGFLAGSRSVYSPRDGHIIFGGYNKASLAGPLTTFYMNDSVTAGSRTCSLRVEIEGLTLLRTNQQNVELVSNGEIMPACIEPLDNLFRFPQNILNQFQHETNWNNTSAAQGMYVIEKGLYYPDFQGSLEVSLKGGFRVTIPTEELAWPARGLNSTGEYVLQNNLTVVNIFSDRAPEDTATLGKVFLSRVYLVANYDLQQFQLAPIDTKDAGPLDIVSFNKTSPTTCPDAVSPDRGYIGVIVLSCVLGLIVVIFCIYLLRQHRVIKDKLNSGNGGVGCPHDHQENLQIPLGTVANNRTSLPVSPNRNGIIPIGEPSNDPPILARTENQNPHDLPIPASTENQDPQDLPIPASTENQTPNDLPIPASTENQTSNDSISPLNGGNQGSSWSTYKLT